MRNMVDEATKDTKIFCRYSKEEANAIRDSINEGLEDAVNLSRKIQAESEHLSSKIFITI